MDGFIILLLTLWPHPSRALKDDEDGTDPQKMPRWSSVIEPILVSLESPITLIGPTSDHKGFNPNSFIDPTLDQSGDQPQYLQSIHRLDCDRINSNTFNRVKPGSERSGPSASEDAPQDGRASSADPRQNPATYLYVKCLFSHLLPSLAY